MTDFERPPPDDEDRLVDPEDEERVLRSLEAPPEPPSEVPEADYLEQVTEEPDDPNDG